MNLEDYEYLFKNYNDAHEFNLFTEHTVDLDNVLNNNNLKHFSSFCLTNQDLNYELPLDEFRVDKSDTKSNTKQLPSPPYKFDVNNYFSSNASDKKLEISPNQNLEGKVEKERIFEITKEIKIMNMNTIYSDINNMSNLNLIPQLSISERMKRKKEKAKFLLGEKKKRETESDEFYSNNNYSFQSTFSNKEKDYIIDEDKLIPLSDNIDHITKKKITILRNRISAQKSRDRKKKELDELRIISDNLFNKNNILKKKLDETVQELNLIKRKVKDCDKCRGKENIDIPNNRSNDNTKNSVLSTSVVDMSPVSRSNFSRRNKLGIFSGIILIFFLIGCCIVYPSDRSPNTYQGRILSSYSEENYQMINTTNSLIKFVLKEEEGSSQNKKQYNNETKNYTLINSSNSNTFPVEKKSFPLAIRQSNFDENLLKRKRHEFLLKIANRIRVEESINQIKFPTKYFNLQKDTDSNMPSLINSNPNSFCINNNDISLQIKNESNMQSNPIVPNDYFEKLIKTDFKNMEELQDNVESLLCKEYVSTSGNKEHNFDEIIKNKISEESGIESNKNSDCMYLHMIIPSKENKKFVKINSNPEKQLKTYYEIGCKIFEINKIYK